MPYPRGARPLEARLDRLHIVMDHGGRTRVITTEAPDDTLHDHLPIFQRDAGEYDKILRNTKPRVNVAVTQRRSNGVHQLIHRGGKRFLFQAFTICVCDREQTQEHGLPGTHLRSCLQLINLLENFVLAVKRAASCTS